MMAFTLSHVYTVLYCATIANLATSTVLLVLILCRVHACRALFGQSAEKLSIAATLQIYICVWIAKNVVTVPSQVYQAALSWPRDGETPVRVKTMPLFWVCILPYCTNTMPAVSVFFLVLERNIALFLPFHYKTWSEGRRPVVATLCAMLAVLVPNLAAPLAQMPAEEETECTTFTCLLHDQTVYQATKVIFGALNLIAGCAFLIRLKTMQHHQSSHLKVNKLAVVALVSEFALSFAPQFVFLLLQKKTFPAFNPFTVSLDGLLFALFYWRIVRKQSGATAATFGKAQLTNQSNRAAERL